MRLEMHFSEEDKNNKLQIHLMAEDMYSVLYALQAELRRVYKYSDDETAQDYASHWNTALYDLMYEHNVDLNRVE